MPGLCVSGGRDGVAIAWDLTTGKAIAKMDGHKGHVTTVNWFAGDDQHVFLTGAQDGHVRVWDIRARTSVANIPAHTSPNGSGALAGIECTTLDGNNYVVTAGADKNVCILDPRKGFQIAHKFTEHKDFIYSLQLHANVILTGGGDGMLLAHDLAARKVVWGLGANKAAVRCIATTRDRLVAAGDDGNAIVYTFSDSML